MAKFLKFRILSIRIWHLCTLLALIGIAFAVFPVSNTIHSAVASYQLQQYRESNAFKYYDFKGGSPCTSITQLPAGQAMLLYPGETLQSQTFDTDTSYDGWRLKYHKPYTLATTETSIIKGQDATIGVFLSDPAKCTIGSEDTILRLLVKFLHSPAGQHVTSVTDWDPQDAGVYNDLYNTVSYDTNNAIGHEVAVNPANYIDPYWSLRHWESQPQAHPGALANNECGSGATWVNVPAGEVYLIYGQGNVIIDKEITNVWFDFQTVYAKDHDITFCYWQYDQQHDHLISKSQAQAAYDLYEKQEELEYGHTSEILMWGADPGLSLVQPSFGFNPANGNSVVTL